MLSGVFLSDLPWLGQRLRALSLSYEEGPPPPLINTLSLIPRFLSPLFLYFCCSFSVLMSQIIIICDMFFNNKKQKLERVDNITKFWPSISERNIWFRRLNVLDYVSLRLCMCILEIDIMFNILLVLRFVCGLQTYVLYLSWSSAWQCLCTKNGSTLLLWICRFNYDSTNIPPCVYHKQSLSMEMNNLLCTSPTVWHYCGFPGPSGEQWGPNEEESPGVSFQGLAELTCNE